MSKNRQTLTATQCARATGASVRTLRHYESLGLIAPVRAENGYRHYRADDVVRVVGVKALQGVGMSLDQIGALLRQPETDLSAVLEAQKEALDQQARRIGLAQSYVKRARALVRRDASLRLSDLMEILESSDMTRMPKALEGLKTPELTEAEQADLASRNFTEKDQEEVTARWTAVFAEAEALSAEGADPSCDRARAMAQEARALMEWFSGGDANLERKAGSMWSQAWADPERARQMPVSPEGWAFLQAALAALAENRS